MTIDLDRLDEFEKRIAAAVGIRDDQMRHELAEFVAIPTGFNHTPGLEALRALLATRLETVGATLESMPGRPRPGWIKIRTGSDDPEAAAVTEDVPPMLVARHAVDDGREAVRFMICGHLDTVHDPHGPFQVLSDDVGGLAHGPGVMDMKGGLLVAITALEVLKELGRPLDWTVALVPDEETGTYFSEQALLEVAAGHDVGLVLEPALPDGSLVVERMGSGAFMIEAHGRATHVGRAFAEGRSAVLAIARAIIEISALADADEGRIVNIGPMHGGQVTNAVAHHARCWGNVRYRDEATRQDLERSIREVVEDLNQQMGAETDDPPRLVAHTAFIRAAKPSTPEVMALAEVARKTSEDLGHPMPFAATGGVCDGNVIQQAGVPTIDTLGVRGGGMHRPDEHVQVDSLVERATLFAILLHRLDRDGFGEMSGSGRSIS